MFQIILYFCNIFITFCHHPTDRKNVHEEETYIINAGNAQDYSGILFKLTADLDFSGKTFTPIGIGPDDNGSNGKPFMGIFDGDNHTIKGITVGSSTTSYIGIFSYIYGATIKNLTVTNSSFTGDYGVGAIVGYQDQGGGIIENCHVANDVTVKGNNAVGGIAGTLSYYTVSNCTSAATVIGADKYQRARRFRTR